MPPHVQCNVRTPPTVPTRQGQDGATDGTTASRASCDSSGEASCHDGQIHQDQHGTVLTHESQSPSPSFPLPMTPPDTPDSFSPPNQFTHQTPSIFPLPIQTSSYIPHQLAPYQQAPPPGQPHPYPYPQTFYMPPNHAPPYIQYFPQFSTQPTYPQHFIPPTQQLTQYMHVAPQYVAPPPTTPQHTETHPPTSPSQTSIAQRPPDYDPAPQSLPLQITPPTSIIQATPTQAILSPISEATPIQAILSPISVATPTQAILSPISQATPTQAILLPISQATPTQAILSAISQATPSQAILSPISQAPPTQAVLSPISEATPTSITTPLSVTTTTIPESIHHDPTYYSASVDCTISPNGGAMAMQTPYLSHPQTLQPLPKESQVYYCIPAETGMVQEPGPPQQVSDPTVPITLAASQDVSTGRQILTASGMQLPSITMALTYPSHPNPNVAPGQGQHVQGQCIVQLIVSPEQLGHIFPRQISPVGPPEKPVKQEPPNELEYGLMELVWQGEFNRLFQSFLPHQWYLIPTTQPPPYSNQCLNHLNIPANSLQWYTFRDSAKVRFACDACGNGWTSMKGRIISWHTLLPDMNVGYVMFRLFGQKCRRCQTERFEHAMWYPDEVLKVVNNIYQRIGQSHYGFYRSVMRVDRRQGKPNEQHDSKNCEACHNGLCREELQFS